jgi:hypothetical protein
MSDLKIALQEATRAKLIAEDAVTKANLALKEIELLKKMIQEQPEKAAPKVKKGKDAST